MPAMDEPGGTLYTVALLSNSTSYDVICIGSGWASRPLAQRVVAAGMKALIIDNDLVGGDCPFYACVPSKALLRPSEALEAARAVEGAKEMVSGSTVDVKAVFARRTAFTSDWDDTKLLIPMTLKTGADLLRAMGRLAGVRKVIVTDQAGEETVLTATQAVAICTGSVPVIPDIPGLREATYWTPREAMSASTVPEHLAVIGAGAVGCETATAYASFGAKVTLVSSTSEILPRLDPEVGQHLRQAFKARDVQVMLQTKISRIERKHDDSLVLSTSADTTFTASKIVIAAGRKARTDNCGLDLFGEPTDGSPVQVNDSLEVKAVSGHWLYAVGDVNGRSPFTHMCKYQARIAANAIIRRSKQGRSEDLSVWDPTLAMADHCAVPQVIFTQPAVAHVGLTRTQAESQHRKINAFESPSATLGALLHGSNASGQGWAQWVVDAESQKLLGMTVVGHDMSELIHAATVAIVGGVSLHQLVHAVPCFPTMSEVYLNLAEAAGL